MGKHIIIKQARCSYPQLYGTEVREDQTFGPGIVLILEKDKHAKALVEIKQAIKAAIAGNEKLKAKPPTGDKLCLRKPESEELKYKEGNLIIKANSVRPPLVIEPDGRTIMTQATDRIYSGCYVNAKIEIWGMANKYGRRVNAKLIAVQYVPIPAESFDGSYVSPEKALEGFEALDDNVDMDIGLSDSASMEDDEDILN